MKNLITQLVKFGLVGIMNTIISYLTYSVVIYFAGEDYYLLANALGFVISVLNAYILSDKFVFKQDETKQKRVWWKSLLKTYISYAFTGLILSSLLLSLWLDVIHIEKYMGEFAKYAVYVAPLINTIINIPLNFVINKFWAYRQKETSS